MDSFRNHLASIVCITEHQIFLRVLDVQRPRLTEEVSQAHSENTIAQITRSSSLTLHRLNLSSSLSVSSIKLRASTKVGVTHPIFCELTLFEHQTLEVEWRLAELHRLQPLRKDLTRLHPQVRCVQRYWILRFENRAVGQLYIVRERVLELV